MNAPREWLPNDYLDEITPAWRNSPDAWIDKIENGVAILAPCSDNDDDAEAFRLRVEIGDVVQFCWQELVAETELTVWQDHHEMLPAAPPATSWNCVCTHLMQGGLVEQSIDKIAAQVREQLQEPHGWPAQVTLRFYLDNMWCDRGDADRFRLIDKGGALAFAPAERLQ